MSDHPHYVVSWRLGLGDDEIEVYHDPVAAADRWRELSETKGVRCVLTMRTAPRQAEQREELTV